MSEHPNDERSGESKLEKKAQREAERREDRTRKSELHVLDQTKRKLEIERSEVLLEKERLSLEEAQRIMRDERSHIDESHTYNFTGAVNPTSANHCIATLGRWQRRATEPVEIKIIFNSPGGSVIDGLALFDTIEELKGEGHSVTTVARGMAASMGGILLQAGQERIVGSHAHVLIHEVSSFGAGKVSELEDEVEFCKQLQDRLLDILSARSTMSKAQIKRKWTRKDWWLSAQECVDLGFADKIG